MKFGAGVFPKSVPFAVDFAQSLEDRGDENLWVAISQFVPAEP